MVDLKPAVRPADKDTRIGLRHAVLVPLGLWIAMGPGCGTVLGALYGKPLQGMVFGAVVVGFATLVVLPTLLKRGMSRGR